MGIAALALDRYADNTYSVAGKENYTGIDETSKSFGSHLSEASEKKCPYNCLAKDGIINYNGVIFECDYQQNAITLGNIGVMAFLLILKKQVHRCNNHFSNID